jgi:hypothetical protein
MNGKLKSLQSFWLHLASIPRYSEFIDKKDMNTFLNRSEHEGLQFLTTTLPRLGKAIDQYHSTKSWNPPDHFQCDGQGRPLFMGKAFRAALDFEDSVAVDCIRQLAYAFYKLETDYDPRTVQEIIDKFKQIDRDLEFAISYEDVETLHLIAGMKAIIGRTLNYSNPLDIRPCHGSGATACHSSQDGRWHDLRYYPELDEVFSYSDYFFYNFNHLIDEMERLENSQPSVPWGRLVPVPKDSRGPRLISCEPAELMYIQHGLMRKLYGIIETHPLTRGQINFTDQGTNRMLAREGSISDQWATIDLSDASDRVSFELVKRVFPDDWVRCLKACRSEGTILPDGEKLKFNKFAPMGSACCFPVEALVFWACAQATLQRDGFCGRVFVYGDDIIVESAFAQSVIEGLERVGLMVNRSKSFTSGPFRESCGGEYHYGYDVTPVKVRKFLDSKSCTSIVIGADLANNLIAKFGEGQAKPLVDFIQQCIEYPFPRTLIPIPGTIRVSPSASNDALFKRRYNITLQRYEHRILVLTTRILLLREPTWCELLKKELTRESKDDTAGKMVFSGLEKPLEPGQYADAQSVREKWAWVWLGEPDPGV